MNTKHDTSHNGFAPISIAPLTADDHRELDKEERTRGLSTITEVTDNWKLKKFVTVLDITLKSMR